MVCGDDDDDDDDGGAALLVGGGGGEEEEGEVVDAGVCLRGDLKGDLKGWERVLLAVFRRRRFEG